MRIGELRNQRVISFPSLGLTVAMATVAVYTTPLALPAAERPTIRIKEVPAYDSAGGSEKMAPIEGNVSGVDLKQCNQERPPSHGGKVLLYARTNTWWVQPFADAPYTSIKEDGKWKADTHLGTEYAALLVPCSHRSP